jgi:hypothetical protein
MFQQLPDSAYILDDQATALEWEGCGVEVARMSEYWQKVALSRSQRILPFLSIPFPFHNFCFFSSDKRAQNK